MKKLVYLLIPIYFILVASNCKQDTPDIPTITGDTGTLKVKYLLTYDGKTAYMDQPLTYTAGLPIKLQRMSLFSEFTDVGVVISEPKLVDFSNIYDEKSAENGVIVEYKVKSGTYPTASFGLGVGKANNAAKPNDFAKENPLSNSDDYWDAWKSYIFTKTEGKFDKDNSGKFALAFSYHTGTDELFRSVPLGKSLTITTNQTTDLTIIIDAKKILSGRAGVLDIVKDQNVHSLNSKGLAITLMDNYAGAITIK